MEEIAFFDSGIGGLTVLKETIKILPFENYIYFADIDNVPYGTKPKEEVRKYIFDAVDFLIKQKAKMIVIACNTATSVAIKDLRKNFSIPIVGMEPAVKPALEKNGNKKVLVLATSLTLAEQKLKELIETYDKNHQVDKLPLDGLVRFAENFDFESQDVINYLKNEFAKININEYGTLVLGCTHFLYFKKAIKNLIPKETLLIDGNEGTARNIKRILCEKSLINNNGNSNIKFFASKKENSQLARLWKDLLDSYNP
ncbi:MAG: glutamate racemase [Brevinematales bacterium]|nr:glutamate racemase [Brevinematales bacterium]